MSLLETIERVFTRAQPLDISEHTTQQTSPMCTTPLGPGKSLFDSKEHYLAFRKAWAAAVNDPRAKKTLIYHKEWDSTELQQGWITSSHVVLYNLLRDKPFYNGFTPLLKKSRLQNGAYINQHLHEKALYMLHYYQQHAIKALNTEPPKDKYATKGRQFGKERCQAFLEPFNGTVSMEMLAALFVPKFEPLYGWKNVGKYWAERALKGDKFTFKEVCDSLDDKE